MFSLIMGPVELELGLTRFEASIGFSLALLVEGLLAYPVGRWIDQGVERRVMTGGSLAAGLCLVMLASVRSRNEFFLVWAALGAVMACTLYTPVFAIVTRRFPSNFRRAIITLTFLGGLASTVFIPLTDWLITQLGWRLAMVCLSALHFLVCAPIHFSVLTEAPPMQPTHHKDAVVPLATILRGKSFFLVGCFVVVMTAVSSALPAHMINLLRENHLDESWVIAVPASIGVFQVLGRLLLFFFERHFDVHLANRLIPGLIPLGLLALLVSPWFGSANTAMLVGFVVLFGMGNGMLTIVKGTAIAQYVSRDHIATLNGALGLPLAIARAATPLALGWLWSPLAGYTFGLWMLVAVALTGIAALYWAQLHSHLATHSTTRKPG